MYKSLFFAVRQLWLRGWEGLLHLELSSPLTWSEASRLTEWTRVGRAAKWRETRGGQQKMMDGDQVYCQPLWKNVIAGPHIVASRAGKEWSALFSPRTASFMTTGSQQRLQSHLHECLEVTASLPSAVLERNKSTVLFIYLKSIFLSTGLICWIRFTSLLLVIVSFLITFLRLLFRTLRLLSR